MRGSSRSKSREAFLDARRPLPHGFFGFAGPSRESFTTIPSSITLSYSIAQAASYDYEFALELTSLFFLIFRTLQSKLHLSQAYLASISSHQHTTLPTLRITTKTTRPATEEGRRRASTRGRAEERTTRSICRSWIYLRL